MRNNLSIVVKGLCNAKGMKMQELAEILGISPTTLSRNLAKGNPRPSTIKKLAAAFELSIDDFCKILNEESYTNRARNASSLPRLIKTKNPDDNDLEIGNKLLAAGAGIKPKKSIKEVLNPVQSAMEKTDIGVDSIPPILSAKIQFMGRTLSANTIEEIKEITSVIEQVLSASSTTEIFSPLYRLEQKYGEAKTASDDIL